MSKIIKIGILVFIMTVSLQGFTQSINYKINKTTNKINSLNLITKFNQTSTYDTDFKEFTSYVDVNFKVAIAVNANGTGKMIMTFGENSEKIVAVIESAYERNYNKSSDTYWEFQCIVDNSFRKKYMIDFKNNAIYSFWFEADNNTRTYFLKEI
jgi:hypothetical protein